MTKPASKQLSRAGKRQLVLIGAVGFLLMATIMLALKVAESNAPPPRQPKTKVETTRLNAPGALSEETMAAVQDRRLAQLQANMKAAQEENERKQREAAAKVEEEAKKAQERAASPNVTQKEQPNNGQPRKLFDASKMGDDYRPGQWKNQNAGGTGTAEGLEQKAQLPPVTTLEFGPSTSGTQASSDSAKFVDVNEGARRNYEAVGKALRAGSSVDGERPFAARAPAPAPKADTYLPSGTFFRVSTMNGMDAPAGGLAQSNPQPVLMVVSDWGNMPNSFRADVKHCFVIGSAWGDLSAERALARTESLSCIRPNGDVIDVPIAGFVVGPDGRNGFRGRVVSKQGQVLANALWAGTLGSFGDVAKQANSAPVVIAGTLATQQTPSTSEVLRRSALGGVGESAKTLAQYYINLADKLYPVIEVEAGLTAEIVLTRGVAVKESQRVGSSTDLVNLSSSIQRLIK